MTQLGELRRSLEFHPARLGLRIFTCHVYTGKNKESRVKITCNVDK